MRSLPSSTTKVSTLLTQRQVADLLQVNPITVYRLVKSGKLKRIKLGKALRFDPRDIEEMLSGSKSSDTNQDEG
jgi:excisionase family DNA binding protein